MPSTTITTPDESKKLIIDLKSMFGEFMPECIENLPPADLRELKLFLLNQLAPFYMNAEVGELAGRDAIDKVDVGYHTFLRLWQVFSYVIVNGSNSDAENANSSFNQATSHTTIAWSIGMLFVFPAALGAWIRYRQMVNKRERNSLRYQQVEINKVISEEISEQDIIAGYNDLLIRGKVIPRTVATTELKENAKHIEKIVKPNRLANFINNKITNNPITKAVEKVWRFLSDTSLIFWPTWMIGVLIIGITAVSFPPILPIVVAVTISASLSLHGIKLIQHFKKKRAEAAEAEAAKKDKKITDIQSEEKSPVNLIELSRMRDELKQRLHMKKEHAYFKSLFGKENKPLEKEGNIPFIAIAVQNQTKEKVIVFRENSKFIPAPSVSNNDNSISAVEHENNIRQIGIESKIGKYLLGSKASRNSKIAVNMMMSAINNYTQAAFVLWLFSAVFGALAPVAAIFGTLAAVIGSGLMFASFGGIVGALYSVRAFAETRIAQIEFEKDIYSRLAETSNAKNIAYNGKPKYVVFDSLAEEVENKKRNIQDRLSAKQQQLRQELKAGKSLDAKGTYILNYDLKKIDVYNDRYFETQQEKPSLWTKIKKGLFRTYKAINAGQTSIFVVRSLFLAGAVLAGVCLLFGPGAGFAFIAIALTCAAIGITLKLTQLHMDRNAEKKKFFVDTIDARISYLKKKNKQLSALDAEFSPKEKVENFNSDSTSRTDDTLSTTPLINKEDRQSQKVTYPDRTYNGSSCLRLLFSSNKHNKKEMIAMHDSSLDEASAAQHIRRRTAGIGT